MGLELNDVRVSKEKVKEGVWEDLGGGARMKLASVRSAEFTSHFARLKEPYDKMGRAISEDGQLDMMVICLSQHCVLQWEGITLNEQELACTPENADMVLREFEWVRDKVIEFCTTIANYREVSNKETEKNSGSASSGTSSGEAKKIPSEK